LTQHLEHNRGPHTSFQECTTVPFVIVHNLFRSKCKFRNTCLCCVVLSIFGINSSWLGLSVSLLQKTFIYASSSLTVAQVSRFFISHKTIV